MTAEEYLAKMRNPRWYGEQDDSGVDLSIIRENLKRSATERLRRGDRATTDAIRIRDYVRPITGSLPPRTNR